MTILPTHFNSRPHGGRLSAAAVPRISSVFQLTPSRRATKFLKESKPFLFISTHALTEGDIHLRSFARKCRISTHALTEGDQNSTESGMHGEDFNSRPHGGRRFYLPSFPPLYDFNSRPHGGRHSTPHVLLKTSLFQLTPSRRATQTNGSTDVTIEISTHALTEGDRSTKRNRTDAGISTHALTEGDLLSADRPAPGSISTHALTEGD